MQHSSWSVRFWRVVGHASESPARALEQHPRPILPLCPEDLHPDRYQVTVPLCPLSRRLGPHPIPTPVMSSMSAVLDDSLSAERTMALLSVFFAVCALIVTAIGLCGTLAYATTRRTIEIGIRVALGAKRAQVARMVFLQNSAVAFAGTAVGLR